MLVRTGREISPRLLFQAQQVRSRERYWMASAIGEVRSGAVSGQPARIKLERPAA